jgi:hypothetical protein
MLEAFEAGLPQGGGKGHGFGKSRAVGVSLWRGAGHCAALSLETDLSQLIREGFRKLSTFHYFHPEMRRLAALSASEADVHNPTNIHTVSKA